MMKVINQDKLNRTLEDAAKIISEADALFIGAGAGMGVDSGLPDYRSNKGFWRAYPAAEKIGLSFKAMARAKLFENDPRFAWDFYGSRYNLYQKTEPHIGFQVVKKWCKSKPVGGFVYTSNIDGHFQKAGFDKALIVECHGRINQLQCINNCNNFTWNYSNQFLNINEDKQQILGDLPHCNNCGEVARPNVLMFDDYSWESEETDEQLMLCRDWLLVARSQKLVVIEIGAGTAIQTVRRACSSTNGTLIRINPRDYKVPSNGIAIPLGAKDALLRLDELMSSKY